MIAKTLMEQRMKADVLPAKLNGIQYGGANMVDQTRKRNTKANQLVRRMRQDRRKAHCPRKHFRPTCGYTARWNATVGNSVSVWV